MKNIYLLLTTTVLLIIRPINSYCERVYNKDWVDVKGLPDSVDWGATTFDPNGNLVLTGNTIVAPGNTDIITIMYDREGNTLWQQNFDGGNNLKDYGTAITSDASGNIYTIGAVTASNGFFDFVILKYDNSGTLQWSTTWNGAANLHDIPSAVVVDNSGNIYATGITLTPFSYSDFATVKCNSSGGIEWASTYDYVNLQEFATSITITQNGTITVAGGSASAVNSWDFVTVGYADDGTQTFAERVTGTGVGLDQALAIAKDNSGNIYITGYTEDAGKKDIQTVKINPSTGVSWVKTFDGEHLDDVAQTIGIDINGNVVVAGYTKKSNGGTDFITIKYDSNGNELWRQRYRARNETRVAEAKKLALDNQGNIYLTGKVDNNGSKDYVTVKYDPAGKILWEKTYNGSGNGEDVPINIQLDMQGNIFITGLSQDASMAKRYTTVKYSSYEVPSTVINASGHGHHLTNQIIVKFNPAIVNPAFVDNLDKQFANIEDILPANVIDQMNSVAGSYFGADNNSKVVRIFRKMTRGDSLSVSRLGETVRVPEFWSAFIIVLPTNADPQAVVNSLTTLYPTIEYAHLNRVGKLDNVPNDTYVSTEEESLIPTTTYPDANINVDPAWDIEVGKDYVRAGVFDDCVYWAHPDFGDGTFAGSKIAGGWDHQTQTHISSITNPLSSHGTACAGIIGALRNNSKGIAGIAGGDMANNNKGVQLYSFGILNDGDWIATSAVTDAIVQGSLSSAYGLNIQSHSWGIYDGAQIHNGSSSLGQGDIALLEQAVETCSRNACVFVASRGNEGNADVRYPACYTDYKVINVGASGTDGKYKDGSNGDSWWSSSFGLGVDLIAPGTTQIVSVPNNPSHPMNITASCTPFGSNGEYECFNGTSSSAPHVAGVAALMMSRHNTVMGYHNNLAPEDVEILLQNYATDKGTAGYDDYNGNGLLNAGAVMQKLDSKYQVYHPTPSSTTVSSIATNVILNVPFNINGIAAGLYKADKYERIDTYHNTFSSSTQLVGYWARRAQSTGFSQATLVDGTSYATVTSCTNTGGVIDAQVRTYGWNITQPYPIGGAMNAWIPAQSSALKTALSLHLYDPNGVIGIEELEENADIHVYPNPTNGTFTISYRIAHLKGNIKIEVYDVIGQIVYEENVGMKAQDKIIINAEKFANGVYICKLSTSSSQHISKIVKQ